MRNRFGPVGALAICVGAAGTLASHPVAAQKFTNSGFETGNTTGWAPIGTNPAPSATSAQAHTGTYSALLGTTGCFDGTEPGGASAISQNVVVPPGGATLSFWYQPHSCDTLTSDSQDAYITNASGSTRLGTIFHSSPASNSGAWTHRTFDLTPWAGQTVGVVFLVMEDFTPFATTTWMYVDDAMIMPTALVSGSGSICSGLSKTIQAALTGDPPWNVTWSDAVTQNGLLSSPATRIVSPASTTAYSVTAVSDVNGAGTSTGSAVVTVNAGPPPSATVSGGATICAGAPAQIQAALTGTGPWNVTWSDTVTQSGVTSSPATRTVNPTSTTTFTVTAVSDASCSGASSGSALITTNPDTAAPTVTAPAFVTLDQTLCCGTLGGVTAATSSALTTFLAGGSAVDDCDPSPAHLAPQAGGIDVTPATCFGSGVTPITFRWQDSSGKIGTASANVTVRMFGDLNLDWTVDPSDMVVLRAYFNFVVTPGTPPFNAPLNIADLTHDTIVDPSDAVLLRAYFNFVVTCLRQ